MKFLPWFVPRTELLVQLREVGPDREHPKIATTSTFMCVDVEPGMRTAVAVAWEAAAKISLLVLTLYLLDRGSVSYTHLTLPTNREV